MTKSPVHSIKIETIMVGEKLVFGSNNAVGGRSRANQPATKGGSVSIGIRVWGLGVGSYFIVEVWRQRPDPA